MKKMMKKKSITETSNLQYRTTPWDCFRAHKKRYLSLSLSLSLSLFLLFVFLHSGVYSCRCCRCCRHFQMGFFLMKQLFKYWRAVGGDLSGGRRRRKGGKGNEATKSGEAPYQLSMTIAAALGSTAGALVLVMTAVLFLWHYFLRCRSRSTTSASTSSQSSAQARQIIELSGQERGSYSSASQIAWRFGIEELNLATKNFCDINLIGHGTFGEAYKGLLQDGTIVAIKRRKAPTNQDFTDEVHLLSSIRHRNLVSLLGYCQESDMQMLIYEYISNGSVSKHLYGASRASSNKLEFKHRLSIAYGVAKGLDHLHGLDSPMVHMNFKTANVLVDEDFIPKVADAGIRSLLYRIDGAASSRMTIIDPFLDPEVEDLGRFSLKSDVYSFGVFLVELVSGQETRSEKDIRKWVQNCQDLNISALVDQRMSSSFSSEGMGEFLQLIAWCLNKSDRRPPMNFIVSEIDRIRDKEMSLTMIMGEGSTTVTLGSQLFK